MTDSIKLGWRDWEMLVAAYGEGTKHVMIAPNIIEIAGVFFFWDETSVYCYGPYALLKSCTRGLDRYAKSLVIGP